ncbi:hypothetical protein BJ165DRAFT_1411288 [Panaeolus papilionaceus]|nr:hypothetical protein BJ165DRAFT_1411288 [Panaeolus papilionaceus]
MCRDSSKRPVDASDAQINNTEKKRQHTSAHPNVQPRAARASVSQLNTAREATKSYKSTSQTHTLTLNGSGRLRLASNKAYKRNVADSALKDEPSSSAVTEEPPSESVVTQSTLNPPSKEKRKRLPPNSQLNLWLGLRDMILDEFLRHDSVRRNQVYTAVAIAAMEEQCIKWTGTFFEKTSLGQLGHRVQLGHDGGSCPVPLPSAKGFLVFDLLGAQYVNIDYCGCPDSTPDKVTQLLRKKWFPATIKKPHTAFTFECLDTFHKLTHQAKTTAYDFYHTILHKTDNAGIAPTIYRYAEFQRAFRLFRNVLALKRAGHGQDPTGVDGTPQGGLAVECPACPHPGRNLPSGWELVGAFLFLYTLFIAVDANFKLKGKQRHLTDVELMPGKGVFVNESDYQRHLKVATDLPELYVLDIFWFVKMGWVIFKWENVLSSLVGSALRRIVITYDIACQWSKNLYKRMKQFPSAMQIDSQKTQLDFAVPSWHINGHGQSCRENFNIGFMPGAARTCREEVEIPWSISNALGPSLAEMAVGAQHDTLNDHFAGWNFRRIVSLRTHLIRRLKEAIKQSKRQEEIYEQLTSTFDERVIDTWSDMMDKWNNDHSAPNPYEEPQCGTSLQDVRLALAKEDAIAAEKGNGSSAKQPLGAFFWTAFDIEDRHRRNTPKPTKTRKSTTKDMADSQEKENVLRRTMRQWREDQLVYTPFAASSNISGTGNRYNTRAMAVFTQINEKIDLLVARYRRAWQALQILDPNGKWSIRLLELKPEDIRGPAKTKEDEELFKKLKQRYEPSWIWLVARMALGEAEITAEFHESMRVEWAKAKARMMRWVEERLLVQEEMRRVLAWFSYRADWWDNAAYQRTQGDAIVLQGVSAYAHKQADICRKMGDRCGTHWLPAMIELGITPGWADKYPALMLEIELKKKKLEEVRKGKSTMVAKGGDPQEEEEEEEEEEGEEEERTDDEGCDDDGDD